MKNTVYLILCLFPLFVSSQTKTIRIPDFMDYNYFNIIELQRRDSLFMDFIKKDSLMQYTESQNSELLNLSLLDYPTIKGKDSLTTMDYELWKNTLAFLDSINKNRSDKKVFKIKDPKIKDSITKNAIDEGLIMPDSLTTSLFCFDKKDKQIIINNHGIENIDCCKFLKHKKNEHNDGSLKSYWDYKAFKENTLFEVFAEFKKINDTIWLRRKFKNNEIISENKIKVTNTVTGSSTSYIKASPNGNIKLIKNEILKTEPYKE